MGIPPHRYMQEAKLSLARRLLRESDLPITEIADVLGYDDPLYFSRLFRREVGLSPRDYRKDTK
jgi:AraC-like DNA-binding protein